MARDRLNFSRMGLWFVNIEHPDRLQGSFGLDEDGEIRDEREQFIEIDNPIFKALFNNDQRVYYPLPFQSRLC